MPVSAFFLMLSSRCRRRFSFFTPPLMLRTPGIIILHYAILIISRAAIIYCRRLPLLTRHTLDTPLFSLLLRHTPPLFIDTLRLRFCFATLTLLIVAGRYTLPAAIDTPSFTIRYATHTRSIFTRQRYVVGDVFIRRHYFMLLLMPALHTLL